MNSKCLLCLKEHNTIYFTRYGNVFAHLCKNCYLKYKKLLEERPMELYKKNEYNIETFDNRLNILKLSIQKQTILEEDLKVNTIIDLICLSRKKYPQITPEHFKIAEFYSDNELLKELIPICEKIKEIEEK